MLNLQDLSVSELQAYCDGLKDSIEIINNTNVNRISKHNFTQINDRYFEGQLNIETRLAEDFRDRAFETLSSKKKNMK